MNREKYLQSRRERMADIISDMKPWNAARVLSAIIRLKTGEISPCLNKSWDDCVSFENMKFHGHVFSAAILWFNDRAGSTHLVSMPVCGSGVNG